MKVELKLFQRQFGTTFLYITHDQSEALVMSDQVAVMILAGSSRSVRRRSSTTLRARGFVAGFVGDSNRWGGRVVEA